MDFAAARKWMVDGQLLPNKVTEPRLIEAMRDLPRHRFVPADKAARAYADEDVPLGQGRVVVQPMMMARLLQLAQIRGGEAALLVGAGTGYAAAVMARLGARVVALESDPLLADQAGLALAEVALAPGSVLPVRGSLARGHAAGAPYEVIVILGEVAEIPAEIIEQLAEGGRLVTVLRRAGRAGVAVLGQRIGGAFNLTEAFDCATAPLAEFSPEPGFVF